MPLTPRLSAFLPQNLGQKVYAWTYSMGPGRYYDGAYRRIAGSLDIQEGAVLDLGCGPGWVCIHAAADHLQLDCVGIDTNPSMVRVADANRGPRMNCSFRVMDAAQILFPAGTFDRVVCVASMHYWTQPDQVLAEAYRVLKPGGWLSLLDANPDAALDPAWVTRRGAWPPEAWIRRNWRRYSLGEPGLTQMMDRLNAQPWQSVRRDELGFYHRIVAVK